MTTPFRRAAISRRLTGVLSAALVLGTSGGAAGAPVGSLADGGTLGTGAFADCAANPNTCNSGATLPGDRVRATIERPIYGWNLNYASSDTFDLGQVEAGILPTVFNVAPDLKPFLNTDLMLSVGSRLRNGTQIITYRVRHAAVWSDGARIGFPDFKYAWYSSDPAHCPSCFPASTAGYDRIKSMTSSDGGKTITVKLATPYADWKSMFGSLLPAHIASQHGYNGTPSGTKASFRWFDRTRPTWSGGPMVITGYRKDISVTEKPNPQWYGAVKSSLDVLVWRIITDQTVEPTALQNQAVDVLYPQQANANLVNAISGIPGTQYWIGKGLVWEHFTFNEKNRFLQKKALRRAIFTAIDRQDIIDRTIGSFVPNASPLGNHMFVPGEPGYQDNVTPLGHGAGNIAAAKQILSSAGYTGVGNVLHTPGGVPVSLRCTYTIGNANRRTECKALQNTLLQLGIPVHLRTTADLIELATGDFDIILFAWVANPYPVAGAQQIYTSHGGTHSGYTYNSDPDADRLINRAARTTNPVKLGQLLNAADVLLEKDCFELPLYQKPTLLVARDTIVNLRDNATIAGPAYNVQEWGYKA